jgi:hypothetical protein
MERLRDCAPLPHDLVHVDQAPKAEVAQWLGHGVPHVRASCSCMVHAAPPFVGWATSRARVCVPVPHVTVQVDQGCQTE